MHKFVDVRCPHHLIFAELLPNCALERVLQMQAQWDAIGLGRTLSLA